MEYDCRIVLASRVYTDFNKVIRPMCSFCDNTSCSNPIIEKKMSVFGKIHTTKLFYNGDSYFIVTDCDGFRGKNKDEAEDEGYEED